MKKGDVVVLTHSTSVCRTSTYGLFPKDYIGLKVIGEQFWGRAARASSDSRESGRLLIFVGNFRDRVNQ